MRLCVQSHFIIGTQMENGQNCSLQLPHWWYLWFKTQQVASHQPTILHHNLHQNALFLAPQVQICPSPVCQELAAASTSLQAALWCTALAGMAFLPFRMKPVTPLIEFGVVIVSPLWTLVGKTSWKTRPCPIMRELAAPMEGSMTAWHKNGPYAFRKKKKFKLFGS